MLTKTRFGLTGLTAAFATLIGRAGISQALSVPSNQSRGKSPKTVTGRVVWPSVSKGTFNAGRNSAKRAKRFAQRAERAERLARHAAGDFTVSTAKLKNMA